ncbi:hypothetical protein EYF80_063630 [Liparis tanakae]|uniref:Uncharacterized protein n=1 Tax=Liparis tanakae TaxID=230148 RepID=A0A4Z2EBX9_9TELE|nr:hypothetical protein EYF80_063630 [Liparis tanakae]
MSCSASWSPWNEKPLERPWRPEPKNMSNGLEPPKNEAKVAWGSPWKDAQLLYNSVVISMLDLRSLTDFNEPRQTGRRLRPA